jgi:hypothetical protein|tara:strand:+ start:2125 stop:2412 length:288 start_codon:yes stop_codon:yes gene_type:complete
MGKTTYKLEEYKQQTRCYEIVSNIPLPKGILEEVFYWGDGDEFQGQEIDMTRCALLEIKKDKTLDVRDYEGLEVKLQFIESGAGDFTELDIEEQE